MRKIDEILKLVCGFLNEKNIEYAIVGGFAVLFYGNPRTTMDVDYIMRIKEEHIPTLVEFLRSNGFYASEEDMRAALGEKSRCTFEDKETMFRLDIKGVYSEIDEMVLKNRRKVKLNDVAIYIASPEDTIANKLLFAREQDIKDALGIYARQYNNLNHGYLEDTCRKLGVYSALEDIKRKYERLK